MGQRPTDLMRIVKYMMEFGFILVIVRESYILVVDNVLKPSLVGSDFFGLLFMW